MTAAKTDYVKLEYQTLDLVEYNGLKITGNMKILLSLIYSYEKKSRTYYESITTLGKRVGLEPQAARSLVSKLCDAGMISYEERKGSSHIFHSKPLNQELMTLIGDEKPKKSSKAANKKSEKKQDDGKSEPVSPGDVNEVNPAKPGCTEMQAEHAAATATPFADTPTGEPTNQPTDTPAGQSANLASGSATPDVGQRDSMASDDDGSSDDRAAGNNEMKQEAQNYDPDPPFPMPKAASDDAPEGFTPPGENADGEQVEGEPLGYDEIHEKAGAG